MLNLLLIGVGAGLASALLFTVVGWNHRSGLVASAVGALATAVVFRPEAGLAFAVGSALPAWWLAYLALLGRPAADGTLEWYPVGRLLLWIAGSSALITFIGVLTLGSWDYATYHEALR